MYSSIEEDYEKNRIWCSVAEAERIPRLDDVKHAGYVRINGVLYKRNKAQTCPTTGQVLCKLYFEEIPDTDKEYGYDQWVAETYMQTCTSMDPFMETATYSVVMDSPESTHLKYSNWFVKFAGLPYPPPMDRQLLELEEKSKKDLVTSGRKKKALEKEYKTNRTWRSIEESERMPRVGVCGFVRINGVLYKTVNNGTEFDTSQISGIQPPSPAGLQKFTEYEMFTSKTIAEFCQVMSNIWIETVVDDPSEPDLWSNRCAKYKQKKVVTGFETKEELNQIVEASEKKTKDAESQNTNPTASIRFIESLVKEYHSNRTWCSIEEAKNMPRVVSGFVRINGVLYKTKANGMKFSREKLQPGCLLWTFPFQNGIESVMHDSNTIAEFRNFMSQKTLVEIVMDDPLQPELWYSHPKEDIVALSSKTSDTKSEDQKSISVPVIEKWDPCMLDGEATALAVVGAWATRQKLYPDIIRQCPVRYISYWCDSVLDIYRCDLESKLQYLVIQVNCLVQPHLPKFLKEICKAQWNWMCDQRGNDGLWCCVDLKQKTVRYFDMSDQASAKAKVDSSVAVDPLTKPSEPRWVAKIEDLNLRTYFHSRDRVKVVLFLPSCKQERDMRKDISHCSNVNLITLESVVDATRAIQSTMDYVLISAKYIQTALNISLLRTIQSAVDMDWLKQQRNDNLWCCVDWKQKTARYFVTKDAVTSNACTPDVTPTVDTKETEDWLNDQAAAKAKTDEPTIEKLDLSTIFQSNFIVDVVSIARERDDERYIQKKLSKIANVILTSLDSIIDLSRKIESNMDFLIISAKYIQNAFRTNLLKEIQSVVHMKWMSGQIENLRSRGKLCNIWCCVDWKRKTVRYFLMEDNTTEEKNVEPSVPQEGVVAETDKDSKETEPSPEPALKKPKIELAGTGAITNCTGGCVTIDLASPLHFTPEWSQEWFPEQFVAAMTKGVDEAIELYRQNQTLTTDSKTLDVGLDTKSESKLNHHEERRRNIDRMLLLAREDLELNGKIVLLDDNQYALLLPAKTDVDERKFKQFMRDHSDTYIFFVSSAELDRTDHESKCDVRFAISKSKKDADDKLKLHRKQRLQMWSSFSAWSQCRPETVFYMRTVGGNQLTVQKNQLVETAVDQAVDETFVFVPVKKSNPKFGGFLVSVPDHDKYLSSKGQLVSSNKVDGTLSDTWVYQNRQWVNVVTQKPFVYRDAFGQEQTTIDLIGEAEYDSQAWLLKKNQF